MSDLAKHLLATNNCAEVAYARDYKDTGINTYRIGKTKDVYLHALCAKLSDGAGLFSKRSTQELINEIASFQPDVVHLHNLHNYYICYPDLFNYLAGENIRIVWTLHDCWPFTGHCSHFENIGCNKWKTGCFDCHQTKKYPSSLVDRSTFNYENKKKAFTMPNKMTLVTPSNWLAKYVGDSFLASYPIRVIHNGIDCNIFKKGKSNFKSKHAISGKMILFVASTWTLEKGWDDIFRIRKMLSSDYSIVVVGVTNKQIKALPANVIGIERTKDVFELADIYRAADVFVNPTYQDNYPTTNLEAQACGTPVVTYKTGGSPESILNGAVVDTGDLDTLIEKIKAYCNDKYKDAIGKTDVFNNEESMAKYIALYHEISEDR